MYVRTKALSSRLLGHFIADLSQLSEYNIVKISRVGRQQNRTSTYKQDEL